MFLIFITRCQTKDWTIRLQLFYLMLTVCSRKLLIAIYSGELANPLFDVLSTETLKISGHVHASYLVTHAAYHVHTHAQTTN